jgi:DNA-binding IclR family transcriptional regulator
MDKVLTYLASDEDAHTITEMSKTLGISLTACERIVNFLIKYDFAQMDEKGVKISPGTRRFVVATSREVVSQIVSYR